MKYKQYIFISIGILTLGVLGILYLNSDANFFDREEVFTPDSVNLDQEVKPTMLYGMVVDNLLVKQEVVKRNQRFTDLLSGCFITPAIQRQISMIPRESFDFRKISIDKKYTIITENDSARTAHALIYEPNAIDYYVFHLKDSLWLESIHRQIVIEEREVAGVIGSSLSETIEVLGISHELTNKFVDVFAWQIDFQFLQKGDRFKIFYEEQLVDGAPFGIGKILGIYFQQANYNYYAIPFDQNGSVDFYDSEGKSLRKALLKYPIEFTRIASRYNLKRFHPIEKIVKPHLGTDFSAPTGTPIRSVGDGIVLEAQYKSLNGNYVKVRHNDTYTTAYLHMSKIGSGIRAGVRVRQGETIGYVGSTGLSTGPHLHYSFYKNGKQIDALRVELPPAQPVQEELMRQFEETRTRVIKRLDSIMLPEPPMIVASN